MLSVCRPSAAAVLPRRSLLTQCQLGLLVRLLHWEAGDLGSTLCMAQTSRVPQGVCKDRWKCGERCRVGPAVTYTGMCCVLPLLGAGTAFLSSHLPHSSHHTYEWEMVAVLGHNRKVETRPAWHGLDRCLQELNQRALTVHRDQQWNT